MPTEMSFSLSIKAYERGKMKKSRLNRDLVDFGSPKLAII